MLSLRGRKSADHNTQSVIEKEEFLGLELSELGIDRTPLDVLINKDKW